MLAELNQLDFSLFHFLRPELLWLIILLVLILFGIKQISNRESSWQQVISPHLIKFLMVSGKTKTTKNSFWLTGLIAFLMIVAVSGPAIREKNVPVFQTEDSRVILLDLSLSMDATDIKPSRIDRARFKIMDILEQTKEGTIGLVVYAGDAFIISPLTSDSNTIASMIPTLSTGIMPILGSRPDIAIKKAIELLDNAKQSSGQIIWITDGVEDEFKDGVMNALSNSQHLLSVLAVGTEQGAPIPLPDGNGFLKDNSGNIILPKLNASSLKSIVSEANGQYVELTASNDDVDFIMAILAQQKEFEKNNDGSLNANESDKRISRWIDDGYWLSWIIGVLFLIRLLKNSFSPKSNQFNTNFGLVFILLTASSLTSFNTKAGDGETSLNSRLNSTWNDLWITKDQQAQQAFQQKNYKKSASLFENDDWKASANYKSNNFESAVAGFSKGKDADSFYNRANALAKSQKLEEAIESYDNTLALEPEHEDALFNKKIVEEMLKQQQEQDKKDQEKKDKEEQDKKDQEKQDENKDQSDSDSDEKNDEDKKSEKEQQEQQEKEQKEQEQQEKEAEISEDERDKKEKDQALKHWLEKIPDDPGGLLRRKMYREYQRRGREQKEEKVW